MKVYFAGPLFSEAELNFNTSLTTVLEAQGFSVFLPQRDGVISNKPPYDQMSRDELSAAIFNLDRNKVLESDIFLFVLDGRVPDEGACVELGIAYTDKYITKRKRLIVGLHTDRRASFIMSKLNPMLRESFDRIVESQEELIELLVKYSEEAFT